jgi:hypothetical protein
LGEAYSLERPRQGTAAGLTPLARGSGQRDLDPDASIERVGLEVADNATQMPPILPKLRTVRQLFAVL